MRTTQRFGITLPIELAELIRTRVASGEYASESEVIRDGLRPLAARDRAIEVWLRDKVVPATEALRAAPARAHARAGARSPSERSALASHELPGAARPARYQLEDIERFVSKMGSPVTRRHDGAAS
ncbi:putative addiction module CopG family antidote [Paraburkholderia sp. BL6669N2]|uniref:ribbon-helix-helix domain-containing protein n=1 Tax=Paraburkholderia sp. BL6669N2 TaxID=1938807 RepID=UPI000E378233|nr:putative addiction module CopG family antidote [Paraburkholderia sp. BL6669N2]